MAIIDDLKYKIECYYGKYNGKYLFKMFFADGSSAVILFRLNQFFRKARMGFIGSLLLEINKVINGCVLGKGAVFGKGFVIMHPVGVVINSAVRAGENIVIESGVVIGAARNGVPVRAPVLGSNIFIGAGAKILGGITIGDNVKIGANAVVVKDVPAGSTAVGIPARII